MSPSGRTRRAASLLGVALLGLSARAQEAAEPLPYAFAYRLGSGVYAVDGRTVQIYRIPISWRLPRPEGGRIAVEVTLPVTIGFFDFEASDVLESGLPENLGTASLVPGVGLPVAVLERWSLRPFAEAGAAWEESADEYAGVFGAGVESLATFPSGPGHFRLGNTLAWIGDVIDGPDNNDSYVSFETGLEYRWPPGWRPAGHELDIGFFAESWAYWFDQAAASPTRTLAEALGARSRYEAGFTVGAAERWRVWKIPLPRLGLSYRWGGDSSAVRLVFGTPF